MRKIYLTISAAVLLSALVSCEKSEPDPEFISGTTVSLVIDGETIHTYNSTTWQSSFKEKAIRYRVFSDDMTDYYTLECSEKPTTVGQEINATLRWSSNGAKESVVSNLKFAVEKTDPDSGVAWLWCRKKKIGVAVIE